MKNKVEKKQIEGLEIILLGVIIILITLIGFINKGPVGNFLTYIFIYLFGAFYFVFYLLAFAFGIYLIIKRKTPKIHLNMKMLGVLLVFVSLLIISSGDETILIKNFASKFQDDYISELATGTFKIETISNIGSIGGGFVGFLLRAVLNTVIKNIGTMITCAVLFSIGLLLVLKDAIAYIIKFFVSYKYKPEIKERANSKLEDKNNEVKAEETKEEPKDNIATQKEIQPVQVQVNNSTDIYFDDELIKSQNTRIEAKESTYSQASSNFFDDQTEEVVETPNNLFDDVEVESNDVNQVIKEENNYSFFNEDEEEWQAGEEESTYIYDSQEDIKKVEEQIKSVVEEVKEEYVPQRSVEVMVAPTIKEEPVIETPIIKEEPVIEVPKPVIKKKLPYVLPSFELLKYHPGEDTLAENQRIAQERLEKINRTFEQYKIGAQVISYTIGPSVTRYNIRMNEGVRVNALNSISSEISIALNGNKTVRVELVVEGRDTSSIEVGNDKPSPVSFKEVFEQIKDKTGPKEKLLIPLGKDIEGKVVTTHMDELPHLLVAGTTGSGKSVFVNTIIATFIMRNSPEELKLMLIDPKKVEFSRFNGLPHLLCPIITDAKESNVALKRLCDLMDERYEKFMQIGVTKISEYNELSEDYHYEKMSNIVVIIDEYADLVSNGTFTKEIEGSVQRLCQKARACGIFLIICTQRPSVNIITGSIKAVIPSRIGLLVPTAVDSKTILDSPGAESLLGNGDMLCSLPRHSSMVRVQGSYVSSKEILELCKFIKEQREFECDPKFANLNEPAEVQLAGGVVSGRKKELDSLHEEAKQHVLQTKIASTSNLQSVFGIGYARADHILNCLEDEGVIKRVGNRRQVVDNTEN